jgi:peptidoglycan/LPS O-acetylase OafA/YrhL
LWRGFACLLVLVNHSVFYKITSAPLGAMAVVDSAVSAIALRMWAGVPIFFVISGYCITASIDSHRRNQHGVGLYFFKRFRRIFPPYWAALFGGADLIGTSDLLLSGSVTANGAALRPWWFSPWQWAGSITLTEIWRAHLIGTGKGLVLGPAWTLCYEEQFYAVTGLLLFVCAGRFFLGAAIVTGSVLAATIAAAAAVHPSMASSSMDRGFSSR